VGRQGTFELMRDQAAEHYEGHGRKTVVPARPIAG
jgi:hypothetical protein